MKFELNVNDEIPLRIYPRVLSSLISLLLVTGLNLERKTRAEKKEGVSQLNDVNDTMALNLSTPKVY